ncbi:MAG: aldehyde ferredoxin oxidoreductase C-terminal domain-containing protein [Eggerthella lenta]
MCDWVWPNFISRKHTAETGSTYGATPEYEVKFFQAVTGRDLSYEESIGLGHKFWVLDRAIWALEGRHRDQEVFTNYVYDVKTTKPFPLVVFEDGKWSYSLCQGRTLDRDKFEDFKTRFYAHEGFEESTGRPTRSGLEALGLGFAADKLEAAGKLGA